MHVHTGVPAGKESKIERRFENQCYIAKELQTEYCKMTDRFYLRMLWTLTFLKTEMEGYQFKLISPLNYNSNTSLQAMHSESFSCAVFFLCFPAIYHVICESNVVLEPFVRRGKFLSQSCAYEQSPLCKLCTTFTILSNSITFVCRNETDA